MAFNSLTFDGINSLDYGIYITGESVYDVPERDVEAVEIAGRNGDYLLDKGRWKNLEVTYRCGCFGSDQTEFAEKIRTFRNLLASRRGYKRITDTYNTTEYRMGTFKDSVEVDSVSMKRAGEFDVTFNCKPQRYLTSGETAATVANNGTLTNPTAYASSPLLAVKGYGTITFNGYSIKINNETLGSVDLWTNTTAYKALPVKFDANLLANGNTFGCTAQIWADISSSTIPNTGSRTVENTSADATFWVETIDTYRTLARTVLPIQFTFGTSGTKTNTMTIVRSNTSGTWTVNLTFTITYNGGNTVTFTPSVTTQGDVTANRLAVESGNGTGTSTVSILGNPTYIDCDLGEAYMIKNDEYVPLNRYIDLGSDLPILASGSNTFTKPNTVTELKVTPRWWQL